MADISSVNGTGPMTGITLQRLTRQDLTAPEAPSGDRAEFSEMGQLLSARELDAQPIRVDKVTEIRQAIANGTYETEDKLDYVVSRLMDVLKPMPSVFEN